MERFLKDGESLFAQGQLDEAAKIFLKIIEENPSSKEALNLDSAVKDIQSWEKAL